MLVRVAAQVLHHKRNKREDEYTKRAMRRGCEVLQCMVSHRNALQQRLRCWRAKRMQCLSEHTSCAAESLFGECTHSRRKSQKGTRTRGAHALHECALARPHLLCVPIVCDVHCALCVHGQWRVKQPLHAPLHGVCILGVCAHNCVDTLQLPARCAHLHRETPSSRWPTSACGASVRTEAQHSWTVNTCPRAYVICAAAGLVQQRCGSRTVQDASSCGACMRLDVGTGVCAPACADPVVAPVPSC